MKNTLRSWALFSCGFSLLFLGACKKVTEVRYITAPEAQQVQAVSLNVAAKTLYRGEQFKLVATLRSPTTVPLSWASNSNTTATVRSDGTVDAIGVGVARIAVYLWVDGKQVEYASATITVLQSLVTITGNPVSGSVVVGDSLIASASVATTPDTLSKGVIWRSLTPATATVSSTGVIRGIAPGTATIRAVSAADTTKQVSIAITVNARPVSGVGFVRGIAVIPAFTSINLKVGRDTVLVVAVTADTGITTGYTCASLNATFVTVDPVTCRIKAIQIPPLLNTSIPKVVYQARGPGAPPSFVQPSVGVEIKVIP